jgi:hypothetical protein
MQPCQRRRHGGLALTRGRGTDQQRGATDSFSGIAMDVMATLFG